MHYKSELDFFLKILKNFNLPAHIISTTDSDAPDIDFGLRRQIFGSIYSAEAFLTKLTDLEPDTIYWYRDYFMCRYIVMKLPKYPADTYLLIGPYTQVMLPHHIIQEIMERFSIPPKMFPQFEKYYSSMTLIPDETSLFSLMNTFGEQVWLSFDNFKTKRIEQNHLQPLSEYTIDNDTSIDLKDSDDTFFRIDAIERQYAAENQLIQAVSQGMAHKAEMILPNNATQGIEQRLPDTIRNQKNYLIILNTLLRKSVEYGSVPFLHIDNLSSRFAHKIETIHSQEEAVSLRREMVHKYCLLVKNHSMKGYSLLIRKVLTTIDADLTADLSLHAQAERLNINASYLSTLFKKETGSTLTDYVNRKRVEHALLLLNTTTMQIQTIAQYCGIPDVNYFTKTFKKHTGKTPKEYRDKIENFSKAEE